jgi:hypothetical protein
MGDVMQEQLFSNHYQKLRRYLIFPDEHSRQYMCVCAGRDSVHALKIARQNFTLTRTARAILERGV